MKGSRPEQAVLSRDTDLSKTDETRAVIEAMEMEGVLFAQPHPREVELCKTFREIIPYSEKTTLHGGGGRYRDMPWETTKSEGVGLPGGSFANTLPSLSCSNRRD